ncbi:MAG: hypothetical protein ACJAVV_003302 [Alphaproteobacteria bacterium]|jgi:hypothetical protein
MKTIFKVISGAVVALGLLANTQAAVVTVSMTGDNILSGGICADTSCTSIVSNWSDFGPMTNSTNWRRSDTISLTLNPGIYGFAWLVENIRANSNGNPAALLADYSIDGTAFFSNSTWEVFDNNTGTLISGPTQYGSNGQSGLIWTNAIGGGIAGISTNANWVYTENNFINADRSAWVRTVVEITDTSVVDVSAPAMFSLVGGMALFMAFRRTK